MTRIGLISALVLGLSATASAGQDREALAGEGKALIQSFAGALKAELTGAMAAGGPVEAIRVCNTRAPEIAAALSAGAEGWEISRSSHRLRNPENAPDAYTAAAIDDFLAREAAGEAAEGLVRAEVVEGESGRAFRMVKAIPTAPLCLTCHGNAEVPPEVAGALAELYPEDAARGFREGQMRGVFTLRKELD